MTLLKRLKAKILYHRSGCWIFAGARLPKGYGKIGVGSRGEGWMLAHRASYECFVGPVPEGMCVLHRCDNPSCVNPDHLFLGTKSDNTQDCIKKGRHFTPFYVGHKGEFRWG